MPGGLISVFGECEDFRAAMSTEGVVRFLVTTRRDRFRARLIQLSLHRMRLVASKEELSRIAFVAVPPGFVLVALVIGKEPSLVWSGARTQIGEIITIAAGERIHVRTIGPSRWGTILVTEHDLVLHGRRLTGTAFAIPPGIARWRPTGVMEMQLRRLYGAAIRMTEAQWGALADDAAAHGLEQQLFHALIECLGTGSSDRERPTARRHREILTQFEELLERGEFQRTADVCRALRVSERLLRQCSSEILGLPLNRYVRLARMHQVHTALLSGNPKTITVAEIADHFGFRDLGRFAGNYRVIFNEPPSATLRRPLFGRSQALLGVDDT